MLRLIMKNGSGMFKGDNLAEGGLRVFEIDCPELEKLIAKCQQEEKSITLLGIEIFTPPPKPVEQPKPPALPLAILVPASPPDPVTLKQKIRDRLRWHKATAAPVLP